MTKEEAAKLIDLFVDDELPMELASEFKQTMFENPDLRADVSALRQTKDQLLDSYSNDEMTEAERLRVMSNILSTLAAEKDLEVQMPSLQLNLNLSPAQKSFTA